MSSVQVITVFALSFGIIYFIYKNYSDSMKKSIESMVNTELTLPHTEGVIISK
jgi:hypothetical protein